MAGFSTVAAELADKFGDQVMQPGITHGGLAITVPDDAMPVQLPPITAGPISVMPMFEDQNFTQTEYLVNSTTAIQTLNPTYEVFTTSNQFLSLDNAYMTIRAKINTVLPDAATDDLSLPFIGTSGDNFIMPLGSFWSLVQNLTVQLNGTPMPNYQSGNIIGQMYTHAVSVPTTYDAKYGMAYATQFMTKQGKLATEQFFNRPKAGGQIPQFSDFAGITKTAATTTVGQYTYFNIPLKNLWTNYGQPGRFWTNDGKLKFNFVFSGLTLQGTMVNLAPLAIGGSYQGAVTGTTAITNFGDPNLISTPVSITITDMLMVFPLFNIKPQVSAQAAALVAERPLSMLMNNVEMIPDPNLQNIDLSVATNWGLGPYRTMVKGSGYLPHHCFIVPIVTVTYGRRIITAGSTPTYVWPFGVTDLETSRTVLMPGMAWFQRIYLGGQPYYDDPVAVLWGVSDYVGQINGFTQAVEKRARALQQQGNYLSAVDQQWLNGAADFAKLRLTRNANVALMDDYSTLLPQELVLGEKLFSWAMSIGANGISLSQDPSLDTITDSRQQSFEVQIYTMPFWKSMFGAPTKNAETLSFFTNADSVWYNAENTIIPAIPTAASMSIAYGLPYLMMINYGRGRSTQYEYLQPMAPSTTNVPM